MPLSEKARRAAAGGDGYSWQAAWSLQEPGLQYKGYRSAPHPATLPYGFASNATSFRCGPGEAFGKRLGVSTAVAAATGLPAGTFKGLSPEYDDGTYKHWIIAWKEADNDVHLYWRTYTKSSGVYSSWTQVTQDSGKYGDTALTDPDNGRVQFFWCEVPAGGSSSSYLDWHTITDDVVCFVSDGTNVRAGSVTNIVVTGSITGKFSHCNGIPTPVGNIGVVYDMRDWLDMSQAATPTGSGAGDWGTVNDTNSTWVFTTGAGSGTPAVLTGSDSADIVFDAEEITYGDYTSDTNYIPSKQFVLIAHASKGDFWENADFYYQSKTGAGAYAWVQFDNPPLVLSTNVANYEMVVFEFPDKLPEAAADLFVNGLRIVTRVTTPVSTTVTIYAMGTSGTVRGGTQYGICRVNLGGQVFSPGVIVALSGFGAIKAEGRKENAGVLDATTREDFPGSPSNTIRTHSRALPDGFVLPIDTRVYYRTVLNYSNPHQGELDTNAADYVYIYRKEPGDRDFYRVDRVIQGTFGGGGSWSYTSGTAGSTRQYTDNALSEYRNFRDTLPDESVKPCVPFQSGKAIGPRAYVLEDTAFGCQLRISEYGSPVRFVEGVAQSADQKGGFNAKVPNEKGRAVAQTVSGGRPSAVYVFTDQSVWRLIRGTDGVVMFDLARESALGCCSGQSVAQLDGSLCWHDKNRDFRALDSPNLSRFKVDEFDTVPDSYIGVIETVFWKGRCYTTIVASGGTEPTEVMVYNFALGEYESKDTFTSTVEPESWIPWREGGTNKLYYVGADGAFYEYEKSGQHTDAGQAISWLVESREWANTDAPNWEPIGIRHMGIVCTDLSSGTITCTRIFTSPAASPAGTIDIDVSTAYAWKQDTKSGASGTESPGGEGNGVRLRWSGSLSAAFECYALVAEAKNVELGGNS